MDNAILQQLQQKYGTADFSRYQVTRTPWYDTVRYNPAGTAQIAFFTVPLGGTDAVSGLAKTFEETNVVKPGSFGQTYFLLKAIRMEFFLVAKNRQANAAVSGDTAASTHGLSHQATNYYTTLAQILQRGVLNISFAQKQYIQINKPLVMAPPAYGVHVQSPPNSTLAAASDAFKGGIFIGQDWLFDNLYLLDPMQLIEPEIQISATWDFTSGTNSPALTNTFLTTAGAQSTPTANVRLVFDGYLIRPQQ